jgi:hypothetical protein
LIFNVNFSYNPKMQAYYDLYEPIFKTAIQAMIPKIQANIDTALKHFETESKATHEEQEMLRNRLHAIVDHMVDTSFPTKTSRMSTPESPAPRTLTTSISNLALNESSSSTTETSPPDALLEGEWVCIIGEPDEVQPFVLKDTMIYILKARGFQLSRIAKIINTQNEIYFKKRKGERTGKGSMRMDVKKL